jgi:hypothetical protein
VTTKTCLTWRLRAWAARSRRPARQTSRCVLGGRSGSRQRACAAWRGALLLRSPRQGHAETHAPSSHAYTHPQATHTNTHTHTTPRAQVHNLTIRAKGKVLLENTSLTIAAGRRYGLAGPNGKVRARACVCVWKSREGGRAAVCVLRAFSRRCLCARGPAAATRPHPHTPSSSTRPCMRPRLTPPTPPGQVNATQAARAAPDPGA